jgi:hypothetical protein
MMPILKQYKEQLGLLLAKGHAKFGKVAPRRPYRDDDDTGEGAPGLTIESHPLLSDVPVGAASDLTAIASDNSNVTDEALDRVEELSPSLQNQPQLQAQLSQRYSKRNTPNPPTPS